MTKLSRMQKIQGGRQSGDVGDRRREKRVRDEKTIGEFRFSSLGKGSAEHEESAWDVSADAAYANMVLVLVTACHFFSGSSFVGPACSENQFYWYRPVTHLLGIPGNDTWTVDTPFDLLGNREISVHT